MDFKGNDRRSHPSAQRASHDRTIGLILCGIVLILIGIGFALLVPLTVFSVIAADEPAVVGQSLLGGVIAFIFIYGLASAFFLVLGIGSIRCRRWARALALAVGWPWLATGVATLATLLALMPDALRAQGAEADIGPGAITFITLATIATAGLFGIAIPGGLVLFYRSPHVRKTCERKNPRPSWTDGCPLAVLVLAAIMAYGAASSLTTAFQGTPVPVLGVYLKGGWAPLMTAGLAAVYGVLAVGVVRLASWAWWGALIVTVFWSLSGFFFVSMGWENFLNEMGSAGDQIGFMTIAFERNRDFLLALWIIGTVILLGFLFYVRGHFRPRARLVLPAGRP